MKRKEQRKKGRGECEKRQGKRRKERGRGE